MQQPPGYRPRGEGIYLVGEVEWRSRGNYSEIVDCVISQMQMAQLKKRVEEIFEHAEKEMIFKSRKHKEDFYARLTAKKGMRHVSAGYDAAVFLLSADQELWEKVHEKHCGDTMLQKTVIEDFLTGKRVMNIGQKAKYYVYDSHEGIVSKEVYMKAVCEMNSRSKIVKHADGTVEIRKKYNGQNPIGMWGMRCTIQEKDRTRKGCIPVCGED